MKFDEFLSWDAHVNYIGKKLSSCIYSLSSLKHLLSTDILKKIYFSLFDSYVRYGLHLWSNTSCSNINYITKLQKKAIRAVCKEKYNAHTSELFKKLELLNINQLAHKSYASLIYRFTNNDLPINIRNLFTENADIHSYNTRQRANPHISKHRTALYTNSFLHSAPMLWQSIPMHIKTRKTTKSFNKLVNKHLLDSV